MNFLSALMLSISSNLDTLTVSISFGINKIKINPSNRITIAVISTLGTLISMLLGTFINEIIPNYITNLLGGILLSLMGIWFILNYYKEKNSLSNHADHTYEEILHEPSKADFDKSGDISLKECITLSLALTINNIGVGIIASITGVSILLTCTLTFIITLISLFLGNHIGKSYLSAFFGKYTSIISGILLIILGVYEAIF